MRTVLMRTGLIGNPKTLDADYVRTVLIGNPKTLDVET
jgi:hypothetical protein